MENAARQCGVSESTVYRRLDTADFRRQLQALRADMVQRAAAILTAAAVEAFRKSRRESFGDVLSEALWSCGLPWSHSLHMVRSSLVSLLAGLERC